MMTETELDGKSLSKNTKNFFLPENNYTVTWFEIIGTLFSILFRVGGIMFNMFIVYKYYYHNDINFAVYTTITILFPMIVTSVIHISMYVSDIRQNRNTSTRKTNPSDIICFVVVIPFLFRYCQALAFAIGCKNAERKKNIEEQKRYYELMTQEDNDVALIRIFECFLELAPQKLLQLTIILVSYELQGFQVLFQLLSLVSMTWCLASYYRCNRFARPDKEVITWKGTIFQCIWHFCITYSRVLSIAIVASIFPRQVLIACAVHAFVMSMWIFLFDRSPFCGSNFFGSFLFSLVLGTVYIFTYIIPKEGSTRLRFIAYYLICGLENIACIVICIIYVEVNRHFTYIIISSLIVLSNIVGIVFMIIYYKCFHPNVMSRREN